MPTDGYGPAEMHFEDGMLLIRIGSGQGDIAVTLGGEVINIGGATPVVSPGTGVVGAIAVGYNPIAAFWLESITLHLSAAPTTSEDFVIRLNATDGPAYDTVLYSLDLSLTSVTDLIYTPDDGPLLCEAGDGIDVAYPNSDGNTYGVRIVARLA